MYDVIVVGARVAGASTALLLARRGLKVLAVDRASFPSDTLSTHQVQVPGVARLRRWGILDGVLARGNAAGVLGALRSRAGRPERTLPGVRGRRARSTARAARCSTSCWSTPRVDAGAEVRERFAFDALV